VTGIKNVKNVFYIYVYTCYYVEYGYKYPSTAFGFIDKTIQQTTNNI